MARIPEPTDLTIHKVVCEAFNGIGTAWHFELRETAADFLKGGHSFAGYMVDLVGVKVAVTGTIDYAGNVTLSPLTLKWRDAQREDHKAYIAKLARERVANEVPGEQVTKVRLIFNASDLKTHEFIHGLGPCGRTVDMLKVVDTPTELVVHQRCTDHDLFDTFTYQKAQLRFHSVYKTPQV